jgi:monoamine oxidase
VIVVGAGMAGLVAALELTRAGHDAVVLEARARVGGRVHTLREPFSDGLYAEVGAMRIPRTHRFTLAYCERFGLPLRPFTMGNPEGYVHLRGQRWRLREVEARPDCLPFELAPGERERSIDSLWAAAIAEFGDLVARRGDEAWTEIVARYDDHSTREFLQARGWSEGAIELFGLMAFQESLMNSSFLELLREELGCCYRDLVEIDGGMDRLPRAFLPELGHRIRFGARMVAFDQSETAVTVHYQTAAGRSSVTGDYAIVAVPFPVLRHVESLKPLSPGKQRAIRQLHYDASAKILFQCRRRFWEEDDGIFGGGTVTDLPIRAVYYPDHGRETGHRPRRAGVVRGGARLAPPRVDPGGGGVGAPGRPPDSPGGVLTSTAHDHVQGHAHGRLVGDQALLQVVRQDVTVVDRIIHDSLRPTHVGVVRVHQQRLLLDLAEVPDDLLADGAADGRHAEAIGEGVGVVPHGHHEVQLPVHVHDGERMHVLRQDRRPFGVAHLRHDPLGDFPVRQDDLVLAGEAVMRDEDHPGAVPLDQRVGLMGEEPDGLPHGRRELAGPGITAVELRPPKVELEGFREMITHAEADE